MVSEIDLHGCTVLEAVERFVQFYNARVSAGSCSQIEVVHGYGSSGEGGAIRVKIRSFLERHNDCLGFVPGEELFPPNPGKTLIMPRKPLPTTLDLLSQEILEFCVVGKTMSKIAGKFRRYGENRVQEVLRNLEKQGLLSSFYKGRYKHFQAAETKNQ